MSGLNCIAFVLILIVSKSFCYNENKANTIKYRHGFVPEIGILRKEKEEIIKDWSNNPLPIVRGIYFYIDNNGQKYEARHIVADDQGFHSENSYLIVDQSEKVPTSRRSSTSTTEESLIAELVPSAIATLQGATIGK